MYEPDDAGFIILRRARQIPMAHDAPLYAACAWDWHVPGGRTRTCKNSNVEKKMRCLNRDVMGTSTSQSFDQFNTQVDHP